MNFTKSEIDWQRFYNEFKPSEKKENTSPELELVTASTELATAKADKLREAVTNKILKQQEVKFEEEVPEVKEETKFPRERVINAYSHMHMSPHNTATLEENWWNESGNDLKKTIKQYVPNILEEQLNSIIDKYKSDYLKNRESVWNAAKKYCIICRCWKG